MSDGAEHAGNGVRITNADIYRLVSDTRERVQLLDQTVRDVLRPGLESAIARLDAMDKIKADKETLAEAKTRIATIEMRVYAIMSGLVAAGIGGRALGVI